MNKRAQVTAFIIIAVVIVAGIVIIFLIAYNKMPIISKPSMAEPESYIEKCARDAANEAIDKMLPQGGYINPSNYKLYQDNKVQYLCYTNLYYASCTNQEPLYIKHLETETVSYISDKIEACFQELKSNLEGSGYTVDIKEMSLGAELSEGIARINIYREFTMSRNEETRKFDKFKIIFNSPLYNLAIVAQEIASQEAKFCNFEYVGFMILYPEFSIDKKNIGVGLEASKIYIIEDKYTGKKLDIAVRSCAIPPGGL